jgi:hypothetical protein
MNIRTACFFSIAAVALPFTAAHAQSSDAAYCRALADNYTTYVNDPNSRRPQPANAEVQSAIAKCQAGDTAAGIPPLEKALTNARITLPSRG